MPFPTQGAAANTFTTSTAVTVDVPAGTVAGSLLLVFLSHPSGGVTMDERWTSIASSNVAGVRQRAFYRFADGTEGATEHVCDIASSVFWYAKTVRMEGHHATSPPEAASGTTGTSSSPDPPSLTPSWGAKDTLWWAACTRASDSFVLVSHPTGYGASAWDFQAGASAGSGRQLNAATEDPGAFSMGGSENWGAITVAIRPAIAAAITPSGSMTPAGTIAKLPRKVVAGAATPSGALVKRASTSYAGGLTPTGALTTSFLAVVAFAGSLAPVGALAKVVQASYAGGLVMAGSLARVAQVVFAGSITTAGALVRVAQVRLAGSITPTGALSRLLQVLFAGAATPSGALVKVVSVSYAGTVTAAGALARVVQVSYAGSLATAGSLARVAQVVFAGTVASSGALARALARSFAGSIASSGALVKLIGKPIAAAVTPAGAVGKLISKAFTGALTPAGSLLTGLGEGVATIVRAVAATVPRIVAALDVRPVVRRSSDAKPDIREDR